MKTERINKTQNTVILGAYSHGLWPAKRINLAGESHSFWPPRRI
jgi:hypothetical protein